MPKYKMLNYYLSSNSLKKRTFNDLVVLQISEANLLRNFFEMENINSNVLIEYIWIRNTHLSLVTYFLIPWMHPAKSLVIFPESTVSTQAFSRRRAHFWSSTLLSSLPRCSKPLVQAKILAMGFVLVGLP